MTSQVSLSYSISEDVSISTGFNGLKSFGIFVDFCDTGVELGAPASGVLCEFLLFTLIYIIS